MHAVRKSKRLLNLLLTNNPIQLVTGQIYMLSVRLDAFLYLLSNVIHANI